MILHHCVFPWWWHCAIFQSLLGPLHLSVPRLLDKTLHEAWGLAANFWDFAADAFGVLPPMIAPTRYFITLAGLLLSSPMTRHIHKVERIAILDVEFRQLHKLITPDHEALVHHFDPLLTFNQGLHTNNKVRRLDIKRNRVAGGSFDKDLHAFALALDFALTLALITKETSSPQSRLADRRKIQRTAAATTRRR